MERVDVELYNRLGNMAVLRLPPRKFPGVLVQGDTLSILVADARKLAAAVQHSPELQDLADGLVQGLDELLNGYASTLEAHGMPLPYNAENPDLA